MRHYTALILTLTLAGCSTMYAELDPQVAEMSRAKEEAKMLSFQRRFVSLRQVQPGMTRQEVRSVLNSQLIIGYELLDEDSQQYKPVTMPNPYKTETRQQRGADFTVDYYFVGIEHPDDKITDDELVPLVFSEDKLVGTGWLFLQEKFNPQPPQPPTPPEKPIPPAAS